MHTHTQNLLGSTLAQVYYMNCHSWSHVYQQCQSCVSWGGVSMLDAFWVIQGTDEVGVGWGGGTVF